MDAAQIAAMIADREAGTPGPWKVFYTQDGGNVIGIGDAESGGVTDPQFGLWRSGKERISNAHRIARVPDMEAHIIAQAAELERLRAALTSCISALEHADLSDGVCCCGDDMATHPEPMNCGHSPVDAGEYYSMGIIKQARAALKGGTQ